MKTSATILAALLAPAAPLFAGETAPSPAATPAAEAATLYPIPKLTGSIRERERLLGDLGGPRQTLAEHGIQFDYTLIQVYQGVMDGGETDAWARSVGTAALRTLTGEILDRAATVRIAARERIEAIAQQRLVELGSKARTRFETLPPAAQFLIRRKIAQVPAGTWENLRAQVRSTLESKLATAQGLLNAHFRDKVGRLNLGDFGNTGDDSQSYFGLWRFETKIDTAKLGLWPGGFIYMRAEQQYGDTVNSRSGVALPPNQDSNFPLPGLDDVVISNLYITQFLLEHLAVIAGKLDITGGDMNEFAHMNGDDNFVGTAFAGNPAIATLAPYAPLGAGLLILPNKDSIISLMAIDGEATPLRSGFDTIWNGQTTYLAEGRLTTHFGGKTGHQLLGLVYGTGDYTTLKQPLGDLVQSGRLKTKDGSWAAYYNLDQYFWQTDGDPHRGVGIFGRVGFADQRTSAIQQFYSAGIGGKGMFSTRPHDRFGLGWYYLKTSDDFSPVLELGDEQGGEAFYTLAVTPAFFITADLQVTDSARKHVDTAVIGGLRATLRF